MTENDHNSFNNDTHNNVNNDAKYAKNDVKTTNSISSMKDKYKDKQTRGDVDPHDKRPRFPSQYNEHFFADGRRRRIEYVYDEQGNKVRPKTVLEQTGRRKPYKQSEKDRLAIEWRRTKMSEFMVMGKNMPEISKILHIPMSTIKNDYIYLKNQAREEIKNHIDDLPLQIKNAIQGLDKLISMLYDLQDLDSIKAQGRRTSDHVRVLAINSMMSCIKERIGIMTSAQTVNHALGFVERTREDIKEKLGKDLEEVVKESQVSSMAIDDAIANNPELKQYLEQQEQEQQEQEPKSDEEIERERNEQFGLYDIDTDDAEEEQDRQIELREGSAISVIDQGHKNDNNDDDDVNSNNDDDDNENKQG